MWLLNEPEYSTGHHGMSTTWRAGDVGEPPHAHRATPAVSAPRAPIVVQYCGVAYNPVYACIGVTGVGIRPQDPVLVSLAMTISLQERLTIVCPACGALADYDVWLIVDVAEQPEAAAALASARLNVLGCEQCGHRFLAPTPLLYHDQAHRRVVFVPPPETDELTWRDMAYELHAVLVGSIALEQRQLYLSDMQIAQDQAGLAHMLQKSTRRTSSGGAPPSFGKPVSSIIGSVPDVPAATPTATAAVHSNDPDQLLHAIQQLLDADSPAAMQNVVQQAPALLTQAAQNMLEQLADVAVEQREYTAADALHRARIWLFAYQSGMTPLEPHALVGHAPADLALVEVTAEHQHHLLAAHTPTELWQVLHQFPELQGDWVDAALNDLIDQYAHEGNERLASQLEERRSALVQLRRDPPPPPPTDPLQDALEALLTAPDEESLAQVLITYPDLLSDAAQVALDNLADEAQQSDDEDLASYARECRAMLQQVRAGLQA